MGRISYFLSFLLAFLIEWILSLSLSLSLSLLLSLVLSSFALGFTCRDAETVHQHLRHTPNRQEQLPQRYMARKAYQHENRRKQCGFVDLKKKKKIGHDACRFLNPHGHGSFED